MIEINKIEDKAMYKIGLSTKGCQPNEEMFKGMSEAGISAVEISLPFELCSAIHYKELASLSKRFDITLWSFHLPFQPFEQLDISSIQKEVREYTIGYWTELIKKGANIGIDKFIVHPSAEPIEEKRRSENLKYSMESLDRLAEIAYAEGAAIAVEDLPRTCLGNSADEIGKLISVNDKLRVCFDTNHLLLDDHISFIKKLGSKIITLHVSDYDFINERHWLPGKGKIDWKALVEALIKAEYKGVWMYEVALENYTFEEFYKNGKTIITGRQTWFLEG